MCSMHHLGVVYVDVCMCMCVHVCMCMCVHVCMCAWMCMNMEHGTWNMVCRALLSVHVIIKYEIPSRCRVWMCEYAHVCACRVCCVYDVCRGRQGVVCACEYVHVVCVCVCICKIQTNKQKGRQHSDFPGGHPPEYYPSLRLLNFAKRTGYGALSLRWPSTLSILYPSHTHLSSHTHAQNEWSTRARPKRNHVH
jgi:hypothetical protein